MGNVYDANAELWHDRHSRLTRVIRNWQVVSGALAVIAIGSTATSLVLARKPASVPYMVAVDSMGQAQSIAVPVTPGAIDERLKLSTISAVIKDARSIYSNPYQQRWYLVETAYAYLRGSAVPVFDDYQSQNNPFQLGQTMTRTVHIDYARALPVDANSFEVGWTEYSKLLNGNAAGPDTHWQAELHMTIGVPPTEQEKYLVNPLGMYIDSLRWSQVMEVQAHAN